MGHLTGTWLTSARMCAIQVLCAALTIMAAEAQSLPPAFRVSGAPLLTGNEYDYNGVYVRLDHYTCNGKPVYQLHVIDRHEDPVLHQNGPGPAWAISPGTLDCARGVASISSSASHCVERPDGASCVWKAVSKDCGDDEHGNTVTWCPAPRLTVVAVDCSALCAPHGVPASGFTTDGPTCECSCDFWYTSTVEQHDCGARDYVAIAVLWAISCIGVVGGWRVLKLCSAKIADRKSASADRSARLLSDATRRLEDLEAERKRERREQEQKDKQVAKPKPEKRTVAGVLAGAQLSNFALALSESGCVSVDDIKLAPDEELLALGMTMMQLRRLRRALEE